MPAHRDSPDDRLSRPLRYALERQARTPAGDCPDASTLAAYYDGALTSDERTRWESHVSSCARCQQQLAAMVQSDPERVENSTTTAPGLLARWRWLVPITAAGTALATWLVVTDVDSTRTNGPATSDRAVSGVAPPDEAATAATPAPVEREIRSETAAASEPVAPTAQERAAGRRASPPPVGPPAAAESDDRDGQPAPSSGRSGVVAGRLALEERVEESPTERRAMERADTSRAADALSAPGIPGGTAGGVVGGVYRRPVSIVLSPDPAIRWQLGPSGQILRSEDAGASWSARASGVTADLLAGSCPSARICWAVGTAGTVIRTTDGERWEQAASAPTGETLVEVEAVNADAAVVRTQGGSRYRTTDGGRSWQSQ